MIKWITQTSIFLNLVLDIRLCRKLVQGLYKHTHIQKHKLSSLPQSSFFEIRILSWNNEIFSTKSLLGKNVSFLLTQRFLIKYFWNIYKSLISRNAGIMKSILLGRKCPSRIEKLLLEHHNASKKTFKDHFHLTDRFFHLKNYKML